MSNSSDPRAILNDPSYAYLEKYTVEKVIDLHGQAAVDRLKQIMASLPEPEEFNPDGFQMTFDRVTREYLLVYVPFKSGPRVVEMPLARKQQMLQQQLQQMGFQDIMQTLVGDGPLPDCGDPNCPEHGHGGKKPHELN